MESYLRGSGVNGMALGDIILKIMSQPPTNNSINQHRSLIIGKTLEISLIDGTPLLQAMQ